MKTVHTNSESQQVPQRVCAAGDCDQPAREDGFCSGACFEAADSGQVSQPTYTEWVEGPRDTTEQALCEIPGCEARARYRGTCSPDHYREQALRRQAALHRYPVDDEPAGPREGWREDGTVDVDAVRAGTPDLADAPAVLESLCDEVERLRAGEDLLREVARALTIPLPAKTAEDAQEYLWSLTRRARLVQEAVAAALDPEDAADLAMATQHVQMQASWQDGSYRTREGGVR